jgi:two-component system response regulator NreC
MTKVLVYDNYQLIRAGLESILQNLTSVEVIGKYEKLSPLVKVLRSGLETDLIVLSLGELEEENLAWIKMVKEASVARILVIRENCDSRGVKEAFELGVNGCIAKDDDVFEIENALRRIQEGQTYLSSSIGISALDHCAAISSFPGERVSVSSREAEILRLIAQGLTNQEIADKLFTSKRTVEGHRQSLINKTRSNNTAQLIVKAMKMRLLD